MQIKKNKTLGPDGLGYVKGGSVVNVQKNSFR
jgi:hypothetical protein